MPKQEILPPKGALQVSRPQSAMVTVNVPSANVSGGYITSALDRWRWERASRTTDALTKLNKSEAALFSAQTEAAEQFTKRRAALFRLQEQPEVLGHELAVRRVERADSFRQAQHTYEMNEMRRMSEVTHARTTLTRERTELTDAEQQLRAQEDHGYLTYELAHKKKQIEFLDIELSQAERRRLLRRQQIEDDDEPSIPEDEIDDALQARRDQLNAAGLDTTQIDQAIQRRRR
jgi:hypothetical protein